MNKTCKKHSDIKLMNAYVLEEPLDLFHDLTVSVRRYLKNLEFSDHSACFDPKCFDAGWCGDANWESQIAVFNKMQARRFNEVQAAYKTFDKYKKRMALDRGFTVRVSYNVFADGSPIFIFKAHNNGTTMLVTYADLSTSKLPALDLDFEHAQKPRKKLKQ